ncbi:MAG TPA: homoserine O-acetyltransferase [Puia sp.]|nr:homoserine O-acetyltransferase [Puia sp.]
MDYFEYKQPFELECGETLPGITIAYNTYGRMNVAKDNVVWVCHALTANSDVADWWKGLIGEGWLINPEKYFIVCANILGSCYGTTGPLSIDERTGKPYYSRFPIITIRDMVKAHIHLREFLNIDKIHLLMGGSMGGYQVMEWAIMENDKVENLFLTATSATESAWGIAIHTAQRLAIEADATWKDDSADAGKNGLKAARAVGILSYRNYGILVKKQTEEDVHKIDNYKASSYVDYQGDKLARRFNAYSYWLLTKSMDSHHIARGRKKNVEQILQSIHQRTLIIGINSDILCPMEELHFLAKNIPDSTMIEIDSAYGHDGFLVEVEKISKALDQWMKEKLGDE